MSKQASHIQTAALLKLETIICQSTDRYLQISAIIFPWKEHGCSSFRSALAYIKYNRIDLEHFWENTIYVTSLKIVFHISKSVKEDEMLHTSYESPLLNCRLVLSNCFKYISVCRVGCENASSNYSYTKCEVALFSCNIQSLYATTLRNITFTNTYTSSTQPRKIN